VIHQRKSARGGSASGDACVMGEGKIMAGKGDASEGAVVHRKRAQKKAPCGKKNRLTRSGRGKKSRGQNVEVRVCASQKGGVRAGWTCSNAEKGKDT